MIHRLELVDKNIIMAIIYCIVQEDREISELDREIDDNVKIQTELLEMTWIISHLKNTLDGIIRRCDTA